jgi:hypothetical protein
VRPFDWTDPEFVAVWQRVPIAVPLGEGFEFQCGICGRCAAVRSHIDAHVAIRHPMPTIVNYEGRA